jgi:hypothetical protein
MTACNYTPAQIDDMPFVDILELFKYWREWPPTHIILNYVHKDRSGDETSQEEKPKPIDPNDPSGIGAFFSSNPAFAKEIEKRKNIQNGE